MKRPNLRQLDLCVNNLKSVTDLRKVLEKIEKCGQAVEKNLNLADICSDPANLKSLEATFGRENFEFGMQVLTRFALDGYTARSFTTHTEIQGDKKRDFIYRAVASWKQFDAVLTIQNSPISTEEFFFILNPAKGEHWKKVKSIPAGSLVTVFLKTAKGKRVSSQEILAAERYEAVFDTVQLDRLDAQPAPVIQLNSVQPKAAPKKTAPRPSAAPTFQYSRYVAAKNGPPAMSFKVVISKMDTFVHAGNAQLIMSHVRNYQGKTEMFVLRDTKKAVRLDADSIWGAEIRNGETVLFEFYGPQPTEEFLKELAKKVNKYTQMDKIANE